MLYKCGIGDNVHKWLSSYLIRRKPCVKINVLCIKMEEIKSGVPQGLVLGAILFIIYNNDLYEAKLQGKLTSFADDTSVCFVEQNWQLINRKRFQNFKFCLLDIYLFLRFWGNSFQEAVALQCAFSTKLRNANQFSVPTPNLAYFTRTYNFIAPWMFNIIPDCIRFSTNKHVLKNKFKKWLFKKKNIDFCLSFISSNIYVN